MTDHQRILSNLHKAPDTMPTRESQTDEPLPDRTAQLEAMIRKYYQWIEQGIATGDQTLDAQGYREWRQRMDEMQSCAKALLEGKQMSEAMEDQDRAAFEQAVTQQGMSVNLLRMGPASRWAGEYADSTVHTCWNVWKLALEYARAQPGRAAQLEAMVREYHQWVEQGIAMSDETLDLPGYREWHQRLDEMQLRAKALLEEEKR